MIPRLLLPVLLAAAIPLLQIRIDDRLGAFRRQEESVYLWRSSQVRRLFPGFETLAADLYWLQTVQYFGSQRVFSSERTFPLLRPLIDLTTTLDPRLEIAYRYGAVFLCEPQPMGAGRPEEGVAVLERGVAALPTSWRLRQDLGFFIYLYLDDPERASAVLIDASRLPGAPFWLAAMGADIMAEGGDRAKARRMWQRMFDQAEPGVLKSNAFLRLQILDGLDQAEGLHRSVQEFARRVGRNPARLDELLAVGLWRGPLLDPSGTPFDYDQIEGAVQISRASPLWRPLKRPVKR